MTSHLDFQNIKIQTENFMPKMFQLKVKNPGYSPMPEQTIICSYDPGADISIISQDVAINLDLHFPQKTETCKFRWFDDTLRTAPVHKLIYEVNLHGEVHRCEVRAAVGRKVRNIIGLDALSKLNLAHTAYNPITLAFVGPMDDNTIQETDAIIQNYHIQYQSRNPRTYQEVIDTLEFAEGLDNLHLLSLFF
jgi:hypothetical protein